MALMWQTVRSFYGIRIYESLGIFLFQQTGLSDSSLPDNAIWLFGIVWKSALEYWQPFAQNGAVGNVQGKRIPSIRRRL